MKHGVREPCEEDKAVGYLHGGGRRPAQIDRLVDEGFSHRWAVEIDGDARVENDDAVLGDVTVVPRGTVAEGQPQGGVLRAFAERQEVGQTAACRFTAAPRVTVRDTPAIGRAADGDP